MFKKTFIVALILISCRTDNAAKSKNAYTLNISLPKVKDDVKVYLRKQEDNLTINLDSTILKNQKASFSGTINSPEVFGVFIEGYKEGIFPIVEKGSIHIIADANDLSNSEISGTKLNDQLAVYKRKSIEISSKMNELFHDFQKARAENNSERLDQINQQMQKIESEKIEYSIEFIKENSDSFVASMILHSLSLNQDISDNSIAELYILLTEEVKKSEFSKNVALKLEISRVRNDSLN